jgi:polyhydroxyalkanoate synthase
MEKLFEQSLDPFNIAASMGSVNAAWMDALPQYTDKLVQLNAEVGDVGAEAAKSFFGLAEMVVDGDRDDEDVLLAVVKQYAASMRRYHSVLSRWLNDVVDQAPGVGEKEKQRSAFWIAQMMQTLAPSNCFHLNPGAVQRFLNSKGGSLRGGIDHWRRDVEASQWTARLVDEDYFTLGENIATTTGAVVYRNELMELIQYAPTTETVYQTPIVMIQPWINKYYIFDLRPANSFVRHLIAQGFTVFITSWKNPRGDMRHTRFEDYMLQGALKAIQVAGEICQTDQVHASGYCIGGTVLAALMAWLNREDRPEEKNPVVDWTLFSTLLDFSEPGELGVFIDAASIEAVQNLMKSDGYLDKRYLGLVFRMLNSEGLIWRYHINNYLCGQDPPRSDMLFWNSDGTRLSEAMCSFYLEAFYLNNRLIEKDNLVLGGRPIDLGAIRQPLYAVGGQKDHICPWQSTYTSLRPLNTETRYVLTDEGHITGIVNPPSPRSKKKWWGGRPVTAQAPQAWAEAQRERRGSWWPDWTAWLAQRAPLTGPPPDLGSSRYPALTAAPGTYVLEK